MGNERIVASGIYYYDCDNITSGHISFRVAVYFDEQFYGQRDHEDIKPTWGME